MTWHDRNEHAHNLKGARWYRLESQSIHPDDQVARSWAKQDSKTMVQMAKELRMNRNINRYLPS